MADCLFCGIIEGKIKGDIVYRDERIVAFKDVRPQAPLHVLIVPVKHIAALSDLKDEDKDLVGAIHIAAGRLAEQHGVAKGGYRVVVNNGADAGQSVFHIHFHLLGGRHFSWPPG